MEFYGSVHAVDHPNLHVQYLHSCPTCFITCDIGMQVSIRVCTSGCLVVRPSDNIYHGYDTLLSQLLIQVYQSILNYADVFALSEDVHLISFPIFRLVSTLLQRFNLVYIFRQEYL